MFVTFQFPFGDIRAFSPENNRLSNPTWPCPKEGQYLRSAGEVRRRYLGGLNNWIGESSICVANHALKFSDNRRDFMVGNAITFQPCFRRFFFDGQVAGKFEVGFQVKCREGNLILDCDGFESLLKKLLWHPVRIPNRDGKRTVPLIKAGIDLASLCYYSSSPRFVFNDFPAGERLVQSGSPMLFIEASCTDSVAHRFSATRVTGLDENEASLSHFWHKRSGSGAQEIRCWLMNCQGRRSDYTRELRISLLRLNACRVGLEVLVDGLLKKTITPFPRSEASHRLQYYLNHSAERCMQVPSEFRGSTLLGIACQTESSVLMGRVGALIDTLRTEVNIRRQVLNKTEKLLGELADLNQMGTFSVMEVVMGDKYEAVQAGSQGRYSTASNMTFNQIWLQNKDQIDLNLLGDELAKLRDELLTKAAEPEHYVEMGAIASAELAAKKGDGKQVFEALSKAGKWSLSVAEKIGIGVATAAIKSSLGI
ncbi:MAG: hypothetical protein Q7S67_01335 [Telluria sp.]|nr:hypothetical protein [Telluria sp.]